MTTGKKLAISAVMGILGATAVFGGARAAQAAGYSSADPGLGADKNGCGNHDGGKCGSMLTKSTVASPSAR